MGNLPVWQAHEDPSWQATADMGPDDKRRLNRIRWAMVLVAALVLAVSLTVSAMPKAFAATWTYYHPDGPVVTTVTGSPYLSSGRLYSTGNRSSGFPTWGGTYCVTNYIQGKAGQNGAINTVLIQRHCRPSYPNPGWNSTTVPYTGSYTMSKSCPYSGTRHFYRPAATVKMGATTVTHIGSWAGINCDAIP